jgi:hypothetical protein
MLKSGSPTGPARQLALAVRAISSVEISKPELVIMKPFLPALFALLCILCRPTLALPAKRWKPESWSLAEAKSALVQTGSYECLAFLAVLVSQASPLPAIRMSARLCSDSDHPPLCHTFYRLILGNKTLWNSLFTPRPRAFLSQQCDVQRVAGVLLGVTRSTNSPELCLYPQEQRRCLCGRLCTQHWR